MKGIPTYTQFTVAFPTLSRQEETIDEISVGFDAKGGGTHGEFVFKWRDFGPSRALQVCAFTDGGIAAMLDDRILPVLRMLAARRHTLPEVTPEWLILRLEETGARPSLHQLKGLYEKSFGKPEFWPKAAKKHYDILMRHQRGTGR